MFGSFVCCYLNSSRAMSQEVTEAQCRACTPLAFAIFGVKRSRPGYGVLVCTLVMCIIITRYKKVLCTISKLNVKKLWLSAWRRSGQHRNQLVHFQSSYKPDFIISTSAHTKNGYGKKHTHNTYIYGVACHKALNTGLRKLTRPSQKIKHCSALRKSAKKFGWEIKKHYEDKGFEIKEGQLQFEQVRNLLRHPHHFKIKKMVEGVKSCCMHSNESLCLILDNAE